MSEKKWVGRSGLKCIWATSWPNQQNDCAPREDSDQPGHPPSLIRVFTVRMKKAWVLSYTLSAQRRLWSVLVDAQADLSLCWAHSHFVGFVMRRLIYWLSVWFTNFFLRLNAQSILKSNLKTNMYTLSHLRVHMVNRLLHENRKSIPKCFNGKKLFKTVTLQILNFILIRWIIESFPIWCNVNFGSAFTALNNTKKQRKFNITPYGEMFYQLTYCDKI